MTILAISATLATAPGCHTGYFRASNVEAGFAHSAPAPVPAAADRPPAPPAPALLASTPLLPPLLPDVPTAPGSCLTPQNLKSPATNPEGH